VKAIVYDTYGGPEVLRLEDVETPAPKDDDEVRIRVHAASVNPLDWHFLRGEPFPMRAMTGLRAPKFRGLGVDAAGVVDAVGARVTRFKSGDEVFGTVRGAFAEFACAAEKDLALKPANVSFEQAASVPVAGLTSLQALRDKARVQPGQSVLVNGASGGVGTYAVQIAKSFGAVMTGVCSAKNADLVRSIGADHVIDYARSDFTKEPIRYDVIVDNIGNHSLFAYVRVLQPKGVYVQIGGRSGRWFRPMDRMVTTFAVSPFVGPRLMMFIARGGREDLELVASMIASDTVTPVIETRFALAETANAVRAVEGGHVRGKVVIAVASFGTDK
jgi:NADPH:quinone reductase-like Zn-dependent oxidoreductase